MPPLVTIIGGVVLAAIVIYIVWPRPAFVIVILDGVITIRKGNPPRAFLDDLECIIKDNALRAGTIRGKREAGGIRLAISKDINPMLHQRLRNAWVVNEK